MSITCPQCAGAMHVYTTRRRATGITRRYACRDCQHRLTVKNDTGEHLSRHYQPVLSCHGCVHWVNGGCTLRHKESIDEGPKFAGECAAYWEKVTIREPTPRTLARS